MLEKYLYLIVIYVFRADDGPWTALALPGGPYDYDPATGTASFNYSGDDITIRSTVVFTSENGVIHLSSDVFGKMKGEVTTYGKGIKID